MKIGAPVVLLLLVLTACNAGEPKYRADTLAGRYQLRSTSEPLLTTTDTLRLDPDGTYFHEGRTKSGEHFAYSGRWTCMKRNITLDDWRDYAGVTSRIPQGAGTKVNMNVLVEFTSPPVIVLDPDRNIGYERIDQ